MEFCYQTIVEQLHVDGGPSDLQEGIDQLVCNLDKDVADLLLLIDHTTDRQHIAKHHLEIALYPFEDWRVGRLREVVGDTIPKFV